MRASLVGVLGLAWVAGALGCADSHSPCGSEGTFVADGDTEHCVYSLRMPIVIEGGFECPSAMPFELELNALASAAPARSTASACLRRSAPRCPSCARPVKRRTLRPSRRAGTTLERRTLRPRGTSRAPVMWPDCDSDTLNEAIPATTAVIPSRADARAALPG